ncbi:MAG: hypothetical protein ACRDO1_06240 [Nocardioidaceae bacterium]
MQPRRDLRRSAYVAMSRADGAPVPWRVYRDPAGHPFCLVVR